MSDPQNLQTSINGSSNFNSSYGSQSENTYKEPVKAVNSQTKSSFQFQQEIGQEWTYQNEESEEYRNDDKQPLFNNKQIKKDSQDLNSSLSEPSYKQKQQNIFQPEDYDEQNIDIKNEIKEQGQIIEVGIVGEEDKYIQKDNQDLNFSLSKSSSEQKYKEQGEVEEEEKDQVQKEETSYILSERLMQKIQTQSYNKNQNLMQFFDYESQLHYQTYEEIQTEYI